MNQAENFDNLRAEQRRKALRTARVLASIALAFFVGVIIKHRFF